MVRSATGSSTESNNKWTFSCWIKRCKPGVEQMLYDHRGSGNQFNISITGDDFIKIKDYTSSSHIMHYVTNAKYRDPSAWYHIFISSDRSIASPATKLYVNGTQVTSFSTSVEYSQDDTGTANANYDTWICGENSSGGRFDGYVAEYVWIDGTTYAHTDCGEFDEDSPTIWKPIDVSGLTFGTNGFYFDFKASDNLGNDANGGTDFTETGLAAADQAVDTPTNSFCTWNPLNNYYFGGTYSQGNCVVATDNKSWNSTTMGVTAGKWYWEIKLVSNTGGVDDDFGFAGATSYSATDDGGATNGAYVYYCRAYNGAIWNEGSTGLDVNTFAAGDIAGIALDLDNMAWYISKNGTWQNSGDPTSGASKTGDVGVPMAVASTPNGVYMPLVTYLNASASGVTAANFGGCSGFDVSSANQDGNGYGNFEYAVPDGYMAICTKNLGSDGG